MNARSIAPVRFGRDAFVAVDPKLGASRWQRAECRARLPARPPCDRGAALTRQEKWAVARAAAVLCTLTVAALALVLVIFERTYA